MSRAFHGNETKRPRSFTFVLFILLLWLASSSRAADAPEYKPKQIVVKYGAADDTPVLDEDTIKREFQHFPRIKVVTVRDKSVATALREYRSLDGVERAEPDLRLELDDRRFPIEWPEDPDDFFYQENMVAIQAPEAWTIQNDAPDVVVAVLDTGIQASHPDLTGNVWDDGEGNPGWNCLTDGPGGDDDNGHGTHVAGIIAATENNLGVVGVNWETTLLSLKLFDENGTSSLEHAITCLNRLQEYVESGINIRVANHSYGTTEFSEILAELFHETAQLGVLHVCSAGNNGKNIDRTRYYPASYASRGIIAVASATQAGDLAATTNYGLANVDIAAPGEQVVSTLLYSQPCVDCGWGAQSGTSMAAPHVAGVAAAVFQNHPELNFSTDRLESAYKVRDIILDHDSYVAYPQSPAEQILGDGISVTSNSLSAPGRLNFHLSLLTPAANGPLNQFPYLQPTMHTLQIPPGQAFQPAFEVLDPDGDTTNYKILKRFMFADVYSFWPHVAVYNLHLFPNFAAPHEFPAKSVNNLGMYRYLIVYSDKRGGSVRKESWAVRTPSGPPQPIDLTLQVSTPNGLPGPTFFSVDFQGSDETFRWEVCCSGHPFCSGVHVGGQDNLLLSGVGPYSCRAFGIDEKLNYAVSQRVIVEGAQSSGIPPVAVATANRLVGTVPFSVDLDVSGSHDPDGSIFAFGIECGRSSILDPDDPTGPDSALKLLAPDDVDITCDFEEPGNQLIRVMAQDDEGLQDLVRIPVMALPADGEPPAIDFVFPSGSHSSTGPVSFRVSVTDDIAVKRVEYYLGNAHTPFATDEYAPFETRSWSFQGLSGNHFLRAVAYDYAGTSSQAQVQIHFTGSGGRDDSEHPPDDDGMLNFADR